MPLIIWNHLLFCNQLDKHCVLQGVSKNNCFTNISFMICSIYCDWESGRSIHKIQDKNEIFRATGRKYVKRSFCSTSPDKIPETVPIQNKSIFLHGITRKSLCRVWLLKGSNNPFGFPVKNLSLDTRRMIAWSGCTWYSWLPLSTNIYFYAFVFVFVSVSWQIRKLQIRITQQQQLIAEMHLL